MIISLIENIDESFVTLLANLESLKTQLYQTDWNNSYIQIAENRIDEIASIIVEQQRNVNEFTEEIIKNDTNSLNDGLIDDDDDYEPEIDLDDDDEDVDFPEEDE